MPFGGDWGKDALPARGCCPIPGPPKPWGIPHGNLLPISGGTCLLRPFLRAWSCLRGFFHMPGREVSVGVWQLFLRLLQPSVFPVS